MSPDVGQVTGGRRRTQDVLGSTSSFQQLALPAPLRRALALAGFKSPSPVQEVAIPLARLGSDLVVQAKSGTGKSLVFAVACLERVAVSLAFPQALVVCPTRELAQQCSAEIARLSANLPGLPVTTGVFIGGVPVGIDQKILRRRCQVVVGTPGRLAWLVQSNLLSTKHMKVVVLDEADQLFSESMQDEVEYLVKRMPEEKQFLAFSATYTEDILERIEARMQLPQRVFVSTDASNTLLGVRQCYRVVEQTRVDEKDMDTGFGLKADALIEVFNSVVFHQALVFCNNQVRAAELSEKLTRHGFPAEFISGMKVQEERGETLAAMRKFKLRVAVSTDLMARGIDLERVNLVCNLDLPISCATYQHRMGRTGRFGTFGLGVSIVTSTELDQLKSYVQQSGGKVEPLPSEVPQEWYRYDLHAQGDKIAYSKLLHAPVSPEPLRHFKRAKSMMDLGQNSSEGLKFWRDYMANRSEFWNSWDPYDVRDAGHEGINQEQTITTDVSFPPHNFAPHGSVGVRVQNSPEDESNLQTGMASNDSESCISKHQLHQLKKSKRATTRACNFIGEESTMNNTGKSKGETDLNLALDNALKKSRFDHLRHGVLKTCDKEAGETDSGTMSPSEHKTSKCQTIRKAPAEEQEPGILQESTPYDDRRAYQTWLKGYNAWGKAYAEWLCEYQKWMVLYESWKANSQNLLQESDRE